MTTPGSLPAGALREAVAGAVAVLGDLAVPGLPVGPLTTYRVGGAAAVGVTARSTGDLALVAAAVARSGLPVLVVGRGSNLLVADGGFPGVVVLLDAEAFGPLAVDGALVTAGAALPLPALARRTVEAGLAGMEWAVGVPGSVGGGVRMNAGGHGSEVAERLVACRVVDLGPGGGDPVDLGAAQLDHGYRHSALRSDQVVVAATFQLDGGDPERGRATIREIVRWRREHQPGGQNAGSVFTNPPAGAGGGEAPDGGGASRSAGWFIDHTGLKGLRIGSAAVSDKHANFIQADAGGSADDVHRVMVEVARRVHDRWGVHLHTEIRLVGFPPRLSTSTGELE